MGGSSLASFGNLFGGSTFGSNNTSPAGTTPGSNIGGRFTEFNPATMGDTFTKQDVAPPVAVAAGMDASGLPSWQTNWLQSGGKGDLAPPVSAVGGTTSNNTVASPELKAVIPPVNPHPGEGSYRGVQTTTPTTTTVKPPTTTTSTFVKPMQGPAPVFTPQVSPVAGGAKVTMDMLNRLSPAAIKAILGGDYGHPDLQYAGAARFVVPDENFYKYATWKLGTAGLAGPSAATQDPYQLARNQPGAQLDANGRPYLNPGYYNSGYGGSNSGGAGGTGGLY